MLYETLRMNIEKICMYDLAENTFTSMSDTFDRMNSVGHIRNLFLALVIINETVHILINPESSCFKI